MVTGALGCLKNGRGYAAPVPRGRPPKAVDPDASCAARLGAEMRARRVAQDLTLHALSRRIGYSPQHISDAELAKNPVSEPFVAAVDRALGARGRLVALYPAVVIEQALERERRATARRGALPSSEEVDDVKRRAFLGLGLAVVVLGPEAAARASTDDWDRITHAWSYEIETASDPQSLLPGLAADLRRLSVYGGPQRAVAQLSSYVASIAVSGGDHDVARRWWRRGRSAATAAGDSHLLAYVHGRQAVQGLYGAYTSASVVTLADEALAATTAPCAGRMHALSARAQALAMLGREREAREGLRALERTFERLPRDVTRDKISSLGWAEERLHHTESYCAMFVGGGERAREQALALYNGVVWRGPAQINLHRATSMIASGDAREGARHATAVLAPLSAAQRSNRFVGKLALRTLATVPDKARGEPAVAELREVLAAA
jgi:transcriptional regulator with XRE-family HTH domain